MFIRNKDKHSVTLRYKDGYKTKVVKLAPGAVVNVPTISSPTALLHKSGTKLTAKGKISTSTIFSALT